MSYLPLSAKKLNLAIKRVAKAIKASKIQFDAISFRGNSGALVAPSVAILLNKPLVLVRKKDENSHGSMVEKCDKKVHRYIIIDDFIYTGETIATIQETLDEKLEGTACVGIFLYAQTYTTFRWTEFGFTGDRFVCRSNHYIRVMEKIGIKERIDYRD